MKGVDYLRTPHDIDDPMWVIGCIDSNGAIRARHANFKGNIMHGSDESCGKRWRWNIWGQDFHATRLRQLNELTAEESFLIIDWL